MWQKKLLVWAGVSVFAAVFGFSSVASAQTANLPVQAEVLEAISVTPVDNLNFGTFVPGTGGDIVVNPDGVTAATTTGPVLFGTDARGTVDVSGTGPNNVLVTVTVLTTPTETGGATMTLSNLTCTADGGASQPAPCGFAFASGPQTQLVGIGGTLTVGAGQAVGVYNGAVAVTAAYN